MLAKKGGVAGADGARTSRIAVKTSVCSTKRQAGLPWSSDRLGGGCEGGKSGNKRLGCVYSTPKPTLALGAQK
jgi:hypothetical protein